MLVGRSHRFLRLTPPGARPLLSTFSPGWRARAGRLSFLGLLAFAGFSLVLGTAGARNNAARPSWSGTYECGLPLQTLVLTQSGNTVTGTYRGVGPESNWGGITGYNGKITGRLTFPPAAPPAYVWGRLDGTWTDEGNAPEHSGKITVGMLYVYEGHYVVGLHHSRWWSQHCTGRSASTPPPQTTSTPKPPPPTTPKRAVDYPAVKAYPVAKPWPLKPGTNVWLPYSLEDKSGKAKMRGGLYQGGELLFQWATKYALPADGSKLQWKIHLSTSLKGPLQACFWAENEAGRQSVFAPKSDCTWLSFLVEIKRVSNSCGGEGWDSVVAIENYFGNVHTYKDSNLNPLAQTYTVNFTDACDLHDAGYGGMTVSDKLNRQTIDFRTWSRKKIDDKFWRDMKMLCDLQIGQQEPKGVTATVALAKCKGVGGEASIGSQWLYNKVRSWGSHFFDANLTRPGTQSFGHRDNS